MKIYLSNNQNSFTTLETFEKRYLNGNADRVKCSSLEWTFQDTKAVRSLQSIITHSDAKKILLISSSRKLLIHLQNENHLVCMCLEANFVFVMKMQIECVLPTNDTLNGEVHMQTQFLVAKIPLAVSLLALYIVKDLYLCVLWCKQDIMHIEDCRMSKQDKILPDWGAQLR